MTALRIGHGFDVHPFSDDASRPLVLGGVVFDGARGLAGHSDSDVVAHAVIDALLGAAGLGDIGQLFPDTDMRHESQDSRVFLVEAARRAAAAGFRVVNLDATVILERRKDGYQDRACVPHASDLLGPLDGHHPRAGGHAHRLSSPALRSRERPGRRPSPRRWAAAR